MRKFVKYIVMTFVIAISFFGLTGCGEDSVSSISLSDNETSYTVGISTQLNVDTNLGRNKGLDQLNFFSSDRLVANVNTNGVVTTYSAGEAVITAATKDNKVRASLRIYVTSTTTKYSITNATVEYTGEKADLSSFITISDDTVALEDISFKYKPYGSQLGYSDSLPKDIGEYTIRSIVRRNNVEEDGPIFTRLSIIPKTLNVNINDKTTPYSGAKITEREIGYTVEEEYNTDDVSIALIIDDNTDASVRVDSAVLDAGTYKVTAIDTKNNSNYRLVVRDGNLTINKREVNVKVNNATATYGDTLNVKFGYELVAGSSLVGRDSGEDVKSIIIGNVYIDNNPSVLVADTYDLNGIFTSTNYQITNVIKGTYTVNPRGLIITPNNYEARRDETKDEIISKITAATSGLASGDRLVCTYNIDANNVITVSDYQVFKGNQNVTSSYRVSTYTAEVIYEKDVLAVNVAQDQIRDGVIYFKDILSKDTSNKEFLEESFVLSYLSNVCTINDEILSTDYNIVFDYNSNHELIVNIINESKRIVTFTFSFDISNSTSGGVYRRVIVNAKASIAADYVNKYGLQANGINVAGNNTSIYVGAFNINKVNLNIATGIFDSDGTFRSNDTITYGEEVTTETMKSHRIAYKVTNPNDFIDGKDYITGDNEYTSNNISINGHNLFSTASLTADVRTSGVRSIILSATLNSQYDYYRLNITNGTVTVNKKNITANIDIDEYNTKVYGTQDPSFASIVNKFTFVEGSAEFEDDLVELINAKNISIFRDSGENVGNYTVYALAGTLDGDKKATVALDNYIVTINTANFTITPQPIHVQISSANMTYGDAVPQFTYSVYKGEDTSGDLLNSNIVSNVEYVVTLDSEPITLDNTINVENYTVSASLTLSSTNYALEEVNGGISTGTLIVNPRTITISATKQRYSFSDIPNTILFNVSNLASFDQYVTELDTTELTLEQKEDIITTTDNKNYLLYTDSDYLTNAATSKFITRSGSSVDVTDNYDIVIEEGCYVFEFVKNTTLRIDIGDLNRSYDGTDSYNITIIAKYTYGGSEHNVDIDCTLSYDGSTTKPTDAGTYVVSISGGYTVMESSTDITDMLDLSRAIITNGTLIISKIDYPNEIFVELSSIDNEHPATDATLTQAYIGTTVSADTTLDPSNTYYAVDHGKIYRVTYSASTYTYNEGAVTIETPYVINDQYTLFTATSTMIQNIGYNDGYEVTDGEVTYGKIYIRYPELKYRASQSGQEIELYYVDDSGNYNEKITTTNIEINKSAVSITNIRLKKSNGDYYIEEAGIIKRQYNGNNSYEWETIYSGISQENISANIRTVISYQKLNLGGPETALSSSPVNTGRYQVTITYTILDTNSDYIFNGGGSGADEISVSKEFWITQAQSSITYSSSTHEFNDDLYIPNYNLSNASAMRGIYTSQYILSTDLNPTIYTFNDVTPAYESIATSSLISESVSGDTYYLIQGYKHISVANYNYLTEGTVYYIVLNDSRGTYQVSYDDSESKFYFEYGGDRYYITDTNKQLLTDLGNVYRVEEVKYFREVSLDQMYPGSDREYHYFKDNTDYIVTYENNDFYYEDDVKKKISSEISIGDIYEVIKTIDVAQCINRVFAYGINYNVDNIANYSIDKKILSFTLSSSILTYSGEGKGDEISTTFEPKSYQGITFNKYYYKRVGNSIVGNIDISNADLTLINFDTLNSLNYSGNNYTKEEFKNFGNYVVVWSIESKNYKGASYKGYTINKADPNITLRSPYYGELTALELGDTSFDINTTLGPVIKDSGIETYYAKVGDDIPTGMTITFSTRKIKAIITTVEGKTLDLGDRTTYYIGFQDFDTSNTVAAFKESLIAQSGSREITFRLEFKAESNYNSITKEFNVDVAKATLTLSIEETSNYLYDYIHPWFRSIIVKNKVGSNAFNEDIVPTYIAESAGWYTYSHNGFEALFVLTKSIGSINNYNTLEYGTYSVNVYIKCGDNYELLGSNIIDSSYDPNVSFNEQTWDYKITYSFTIHSSTITATLGEQTIAYKDDDYNDLVNYIKTNILTITIAPVSNGAIDSITLSPDVFDMGGTAQAGKIIVEITVDGAVINGNNYNSGAHNICATILIPSDHNFQNINSATSGANLNINKLNIADGDFTISNTSREYGLPYSRPVIALKETPVSIFNDTQKEFITDLFSNYINYQFNGYNLSNQRNANTYNANFTISSIAGNANVNINKNFTYEITKRDIQDADISIDVHYNGIVQEITLDMIVSADNTAGILALNDFDITTPNYIDLTIIVGTHSIGIQGKNNYTGTATIDMNVYEIDAADIYMSSGLTIEYSGLLESTAIINNGYVFYRNGNNTDVYVPGKIYIAQDTDKYYYIETTDTDTPSNTIRDINKTSLDATLRSSLDSILENVSSINNKNVSNNNYEITSLFVPNDNIMSNISRSTTLKVNQAPYDITKIVANNFVINVQLETILSSSQIQYNDRTISGTVSVNTEEQGTFNLKSGINYGNKYDTNKWYLAIDHSDSLNANHTYSEELIDGQSSITFTINEEYSSLEFTPTDTNYRKQYIPFTIVFSKPTMSDCGAITNSITGINHSKRRSLLDKNTLANRSSLSDNLDIKLKSTTQEEYMDYTEFVSDWMTDGTHTLNIKITDSSYHIQPYEGVITIEARRPTQVVASGDTGVTIFRDRDNALPVITTDVDDDIMYTVSKKYYYYDGENWIDTESVGTYSVDGSTDIGLYKCELSITYVGIPSNPHNSSQSAQIAYTYSVVLDNNNRISSMGTNRLDEDTVLTIDKLIASGYADYIPGATISFKEADTYLPLTQNYIYNHRESTEETTFVGGSYVLIPVLIQYNVPDGHDGTIQYIYGNAEVDDGYNNITKIEYRLRTTVRLDSQVGDLSGTMFAYDGSPISIEAIICGQAYIGESTIQAINLTGTTITYEYYNSSNLESSIPAPTNVGDYKVKVSWAGNSGYLGCEKIFDIKIVPKRWDITMNSISKIYDGIAVAPTGKVSDGTSAIEFTSSSLTGELGATITYTYKDAAGNDLLSAPSDPGEYFLDIDMSWGAGNSIAILRNYVFTISKAGIYVDFSSCTNIFDYDGYIHVPTEYKVYGVIGNSVTETELSTDTYSITYSTESPTDAGNYTLTVTVDTTYYSGKADYMFIIKALDPTFTWVDNPVYVGDTITDKLYVSSVQTAYSNTTEDAQYEYYNANDLTTPITAPTAVGQYVVKAYFSGDTNIASHVEYRAFSISKRPTHIEITYLDVVYDGEPKTASDFVTVTIKDVYGNTVSSPSVTMTLNTSNPTAAGTYDLTISYAGDGTYGNCYESIQVEIQKADFNVTIANEFEVDEAISFTDIVSSLPAGTTITIKRDGSTVEGNSITLTEVGRYPIEIKLEKTNYRTVTIHTTLNIVSTATVNTATTTDQRTYDPNVKLSDIKSDYEENGTCYAWYRQNSTSWSKIDDFNQTATVGTYMIDMLNSSNENVVRYLVINPASVTITVSDNQSYEYTGSSQAPGVTCAVGYNAVYYNVNNLSDSISKPSSVGNYCMVVNVTDTNYIPQQKVVFFSITKASYTVTISGSTEYEYGDTISITAGSATVYYYIDGAWTTTAPTAVGSYMVRAVYNTETDYGEAYTTLTIKRKDVSSYLSLTDVTKYYGDSGVPTLSCGSLAPEVVRDNVPLGAHVTYLYSSTGSDTCPTTGATKVIATYDDGSYYGTAICTYTINEKDVSELFRILASDVIYDGNPYNAAFISYNDPSSTIGEIDVSAFILIYKDEDTGNTVINGEGQYVAPTEVGHYSVTATLHIAGKYVADLTGETYVKYFSITSQSSLNGGDVQIGHRVDTVASISGPVTHVGSVETEEIFTAILLVDEIVYGDNILDYLVVKASDNSTVVVDKTNNRLTVGGVNIADITISGTGAGSQTLTISNTGYNNKYAEISIELNFTIKRKVEKIENKNYTAVYTGSVYNVVTDVTSDVAGFDPSSYTTTYTQSGNPVGSIINAGEYDYVRIYDQTNIYIEQTGHITITKKPVFSKLDSSVLIYSSSAQNVGVSVVDAENNVLSSDKYSYLVNSTPNVTTVTAVGTYAIAVTLVDTANYQLFNADSYTLSIVKAGKVLNLETSTYPYGTKLADIDIYSGLDKLTTDITKELYQGNSQVTDSGNITPGVYTLKVTYDTTTEYMYKEFEVVIIKAMPIITVANTQFTYNGSSHNPTVTATTNIGTTPTYSVSYVGTAYSGDDYSRSTAPTNAGTYVMVVETGDDYHERVIKRFDFVINKAVPTISLSSNRFTYNGSAQAPNITVSGNVGYTATYAGTTFGGVNYNNSTAPTNAGHYRVVITTVVDNNYQAISTDYYDDDQYSFVIDKKVVPDVVITDTYTYDGTGKTVTATSTEYNGPITISYANDDQKKNVGTYNYEINVIAPNYVYYHSGQLVILPKSTFFNITYPDSMVYSGSPKAITATLDNLVSGDDDQITYIYQGVGSTSYAPSDDAPTNAGDYSVTISCGNSNYAVKSLTLMFTIEKAKYPTDVITAPTGNNAIFKMEEKSVGVSSGWTKKTYTSDGTNVFIKDGGDSIVYNGTTYYEVERVFEAGEYLVIASHRDYISQYKTFVIQKNTTSIILAGFDVNTVNLYIYDTALYSGSMYFVAYYSGEWDVEFYTENTDRLNLYTTWYEEEKFNDILPKTNEIKWYNYTIVDESTFTDRSGISYNQVASIISTGKHIFKVEINSKNYEIIFYTMVALDD